MSTILILGIILLNSWMISYIFKRKIEEAIAPMIFIIIISIYLLGLFFQSLIPGFYLCIFYSAISGLYFIFEVIKNQKNFLKHLKQKCLTPGLIIFIILFFIVWGINRMSVFSEWDEFSHWGLVIKNMAIFDRFGNYEYSTVAFRGYPPATALWEYFIIKIYGVFSEDYAYRAFGWLISAIMVSVLARFTWKTFLQTLFFAGIIFLIPSIFVANYIITLYVDMLLGIVFGYLLYHSFNDEQCDCFYYGTLILGMSVLCLIKASGAFLSLIIGILVISVAINKYYKSRIDLKKKFQYIALPSLCTIISFIIGKFSWTAYLAATKTGEAWNTSNLTLVNIINFLCGKGEVYQYEVLRNFYDALWNQDFSSYVFNMRYIQWAMICIIGLLFIHFLKKGLRQKIKLYNIIIILGLVLYTIGMLFLYIFTYSEYEAIRLASFNRYLSTYLFGILIFIVAMIGESCAKKESDIHAIYIEGTLLAVLSFLLPLSNLDGITIDNRKNINEARKIRENYMDVAQYMPLLDYKTDKVSIISQHDNGFDKWNLTFLLTPVPTLSGLWSIGPKLDDGDIWAIDITPEEWLERLDENDVNYVYLHNIDDQFIKTYGDCFTEIPSQHNMYHLKKYDNTLKLIAVE